MGAKTTKEKWVLPLLAKFFVNVSLLPCPSIIAKLPKKIHKINQTLFQPLL